MTGKISGLYSAPEMKDTSADAHYDQKVDVYALGKVLVHLVCGKDILTQCESKELFCIFPKVPQY